MNVLAAAPAVVIPIATRVLAEAVQSVACQSIKLPLRRRSPAVTPAAVDTVVAATTRAPVGNSTLLRTIELELNL